MIHTDLTSIVKAQSRDAKIIADVWYKIPDRRFTNRATTPSDMASSPYVRSAKRLLRAIAWRLAKQATRTASRAVYDARRRQHAHE